MLELLNFLFNEHILKNKIRDKLITLFDYNYIDKDIFQGLIRKKEKLSDLIKFLEQKVKITQESLNIETKKTKKDLPLIKNFSNSNSVNKLRKKKLTIQEPFNLSVNKPRLLKEPMHISNTIKALPVPKNLKSISLEKLENDRNKRLKILKQNILERVEKDSKLFKLETEHIQNNIDKIKNLEEQKLLKDLKFNMIFTKPLKDFDKYKADVKYNETAILKEEYILDKKNKEEEKELNRLLIEKKDRKEFDRWVNEMKVKDYIEKMEKIDKRKIELILNKEIATNYYNLKKNKNMRKYTEQKAIEKMNLDKIKENKEDDIKDKRNIVEQIKKEEMQAILKKLNYIQKKRYLYRQRKKELDELNLINSEEIKINRNKRNDMISQIRILERIPKKRETGFDPTETPGYGLLGEMSLAELRERLALQKKMTMDELISKKELNKLKMKQRADEIYNKALTIQENRNRLKEKKEIERKYKKEQKDNMNKKYEIERENNIIKYKKKIEEKKKKMEIEDQQFQNKIREINLQLQFKNVGKGEIEFKNNQNNEIGLERKYNYLQNKVLEDKLEEEKIIWEKIKNKFNNAKDINEHYKNIIQNYNKKFIDASLISKMINEEDNKYMKAVVDREKILRKYQKEDYKEKNKLSELLSLNILKNKKVSKSVVVKNKNYNTFDNERNLKIAVDSDEEEINYIKNKLQTENKLDEK